MTDYTCEDLYNKESLVRLLRNFDLSLKKSLSQHFLIDRPTLETIAGSLGEGTVVVEMGAGAGSLTCLLKERFDRVHGIEIDDRFRDPFDAVNPEANVNFLNENFLGMNFSTLGIERKGDTRFAGNIPYRVTGKVLEKLISERDYFSKAVLTVQKEVSDRILAEPGSKKCGPITYFVQAYGDVKHVVDVPPEAFFPPPEVDSSTLKISLTGEKNFDADDEIFFSLIRGTFIHRRKTIRKSMIDSPEFSLSKDNVDFLLDRAGIDSGKRPEELTLGDYNRLAKELVGA